MVDVKLNKTFIDNNTGKEIYVLSIKMDDVYHNIACDKEQFESLFYGIRSIFNNSLN